MAMLQHLVTLGGHQQGWLRDREHVLEEEYFWRKERALLARLREERRRQREIHALGARLHVGDEVLLAELQRVGFTSENVDLLHLVPLVEVAWSDGVASPGERRRILARAATYGIGAGSPSCAQLTGWLNHRPDSHFFDISLDAVCAILRGEDLEQRTADERTLVEGCTTIAGATGETLGLVRVNNAERKCLDRIALRLARPEKERSPHTAG